MRRPDASECVLLSWRAEEVNEVVTLVDEDARAVRILTDVEREPDVTSGSRLDADPEETVEVVDSRRASDDGCSGVEWV